MQIGPEVLRAAQMILDAEGPDGFTVRAIALRANVAPMAIYNHFDGINGVLEALWIEGFQKLRSSISFRSEQAGADLFHAGHAYRTFALENRGLHTVMFMHRFRNFQPSIAAAQVAALAYLVLVDNVERCQESGFIKNARASDAAQVIWSACHGFVALELLGINFATNRDETFRLLMATLGEGFH
jgi:AcrR family transcriptional regulator